MSDVIGQLILWLIACGILFFIPALLGLILYAIQYKRHKEEWDLDEDDYSLQSTAKSERGM